MNIKVLMGFKVWTAGQVIGLIHDIPSCHDLVKRIEREAFETMNKTQSLYVEEVTHDGPIAGKPVGDPAADPKSEHGRVASNVNNPEAQVWGIGKSKL